MTKRFRAAMLALLLLSSSVMQPARAFAPPVVPLPMLFSAVTPAGLVALGGAIVVGMIVASVLSHDAATGNEVRIPTNPVPANQPAAPYAASTSSSFSSYSWNVTSGCVTGTQSGFSTFDAAFESFVSATNGSSACTGSGAYVYSVCGTGKMTYSYHGVPQGTCYVPSGVSFPSAVSCPAGYTLSGSVCNLADARAAVPDSKIDYTYNGTAITPASANDADLTNASIYVHSVNNGTQVDIVGSDSNGNPQQLVLVPQSGGGMKVQVNVGHASTTSAGTVSQTQFTTDNTGKVVSVQTSSASGQVSYDSTTGSATLQSNPTVLNPDGTASTLPQQSITFPTDYARSGEAEASQVPTRNKLDTLHDDLTAPGSPNADPVMPDNTNFENAFFKDTFSGLKSWTVPAHTGTCPTATFDYNLFGHANHLVLDQHCAIAESIRGTLSVVMVAVWIIAALFVVLGA